MLENTDPIGRWDRVVRGYGAALGTMSFMLPSSGAVLICVAYLGPWDAEHAWLRSYAVVIGVVGAAVLWLAFAWPLSTLAAIRADTRSYSELAERAESLKTRLDGYVPITETSEAYVEARMHVDFVITELAQIRRPEGSLRDVRGVPAAAYVALRTRIHRAEEAMFLIEPAEDVIAMALVDRFRLQDSHIDNRSDMIAQLDAAVAVLRGDPQPPAAVG